MAYKQFILFIFLSFSFNRHNEKKEKRNQKERNFGLVVLLFSRGTLNSAMPLRATRFAQTISTCHCFIKCALKINIYIPGNGTEDGPVAFSSSYSIETWLFASAK